MRAACIVLALLATPGQAQAPDYARQDPEKIKTAEACGECHVAEYAVWKKTLHSTGFKTLHRREAAEKIAGKMGFLLIKRESLCLRCHYTPTIQREQLRAVSGVSCESCHGAGRDWIDVHNDYGGKGFNHKNETAEHRARRIEESLAGGMRRPSDLYPVAANCYGCHTVPEEELVNVGGHPAGSADFELVDWSEKIRHNFLESFKTGDGTDNAERTAERKRRMYVAGRALALEYALRGVAEATRKGTYLSAMTRRVRVATGEVRAISRRGDLPEIDEMLALVRGVQVGLGQRDALLQAADGIASAARRFLERHDGTRLAALDPLVEGTAEDDDVLLAEAGTPDSAPGTATADTPSPAAPAGGGATTDPAVSSSVASPATPATGPSTAAIQQAVPAAGERKTRVRPASRFRTIGPDQCTSCHRHSPQNEWWFSDAHFRSADPFFNEDPQNVKIARFYGLRRDQITRGDQVCMDCHGTVVSGRERREINDGVSCESCHGPAADYVEPHQDGDPALGTERPGYRAALGLGMSELQDLDVRARTCTGCHYITDARLISSGHPSGKGFDYVEAMGKIRHWESSPAPPSTLRAAFDRALSQRGAVPDVRLARDAGAPSTTPPAAVATGETRPFRPTTPKPRPSGIRPDTPRPASGTAGWASGIRPPAPPPVPPGEDDLELPPFPEIGPEDSVEDVLRLLKKRLELLYNAVKER